MNRAQIMLLIVGCFTFAGLAVYPPWKFNAPINLEGDTVDQDGGWSKPWDDPPTHNIFNPPARGSIMATIDFSRLIVAWVGVVVVTVGALVLFRNEGLLLWRVPPKRV